MKIERQGSSEQERSDCLDVSYKFPDESSRWAPVLNSYLRNFHSRWRIEDSLLTVSTFDPRVMKSVPPRGSGWLKQLPIFNCRLPIARLATRQLEIDNRQWFDTRYREVVLTS